MYGDAHSFGGQKSVLFSLSIINNEAMFHDAVFRAQKKIVGLFTLFMAQIQD